MKKKEMERIVIDKENIDAIEEDIIIRRGIERYMYVRQFVYGNVLDIACGGGDGSYLISKNPDVKKITANRPLQMPTSISKGRILSLSWVLLKQ